jgi:predicted O-methyltransferase YrrM
MIKDLSDLNELTWAYRTSRILQVAVKLGLFTELAGRPQTAEELARRCGAKPDLFEKILIAATAMGLLEKHGLHYHNTPLSQMYLTAGKPLYQGDIILHGANVWDFWDQLPQAVLEKSAGSDDGRASHRHFILGMHNLTMAGRGQRFLEAVDLSGRRSIFDVGGGPGTYSILACRKYPDLKAVVFDLPETIAIAREMIRKEGMQDRISVREGSWDTHDFGHGHDVVLMSNILHGPASGAPMKLQKAFDAITPGGLLAVQEFLLNDTKTGPLFPALFNVMVGAYSESELISLIQKTGFSAPKIASRDPHNGAEWIVATKEV